MIIDCDTHFMPRDAFEGIKGAFQGSKPALQFSDEGLYVGVDFPGNALEVAGTSPLPAPGSGAMFRSLWDPMSRMKDYDERLGIEQQVILPQFSGWWSYIIEPELATRMAHSHNRVVAAIDERIPAKNLRRGSGLRLQDVSSRGSRNGMGEEITAFALSSSIKSTLLKNILTESPSAAVASSGRSSSVLKNCPCQFICTTCSMAIGSAIYPFFSAMVFTSSRRRRGR